MLKNLHIIWLQCAHVDTYDLTLVDLVDTSTEKLELVCHQDGDKCRCTQCLRLITKEYKLICKFGYLYRENGLKSRDEV